MINTRNRYNLIRLKIKGQVEPYLPVVEVLVRLSYESFVPHSGQNLAPLVSAPQFGHFVGACSILLPQFGQNLAPWVSAPHFGHRAATGWVMGVPHSGQNFVPGAARVPSFGHCAISLVALPADSTALPTFFKA